MRRDTAGCREAEETQTSDMKEMAGYKAKETLTSDANEASWLSERFFCLNNELKNRINWVLLPLLAASLEEELL